MPYIFLDSLTPSEGDTLKLSGEHARYILTILRQKRGDTLTLFNRYGHYFHARITSLDKHTVTLQATRLSPPHTESPLQIVLCQGLLKGYKMDTVVQKTAELGIKEVVPLITARSVLKHTRKVERWKKIAREASRLSGRTMIPHISEPVTFSSALEVVKESGSKGMLLYEEFGESLKCPLPIAPQEKVYLFIGPEGGFTSKEVEIAREGGVRILSLGERILRAETAAISSVTLIQFLYGDLSPGPP